jgi:AcrR family transcriptional regulator
VPEIQESPRRGRPRSEPKRQAILDATLALIDSRGFTGVSVDRIAEHAGVGKATIYRWWPNKAALTIDVILSNFDPGTPHPPTGSARQDLATHLRHMIRIFRSTRTGPIIASVLAEAQNDRELAAEVNARVQAPRRAGAKRILEEGIARGELRADLDCDAVLDAIYGPLYYRFLVTQQPMSSRYADAVLDHIWPAITAQPTRRPARSTKQSDGRARSAARRAGRQTR